MHESLSNWRAEAWRARSISRDDRRVTGPLARVHQPADAGDATSVEMRTAAFIARYPQTHLDIYDYLRSFKLRDELASRFRSFKREQSQGISFKEYPASLHSQFKSDLASRIPAYSRYPATSSFLDLPYVEKSQLRNHSSHYLSVKDRDLIWQKSTSATTGPAVRCFWDAMTYFDFVLLSFRKIALTARIAIGRTPILAAIVATGSHRPIQIYPDPLEKVGDIVKVMFDERSLVSGSALLSFLGVISPEIIASKPPLFEAILDCLDKPSIRRPQPAMVVSSGSMLSASLRARLHTAFQCEIVDAYTTTEFGLVGSECRFHNGFHVDTSRLFVETRVTRSTNELIISSISNSAMPLIRYALGDPVQTLAFSCRCGQKTPRVVGLKGKVVPALKLPSGRLDCDRLTAIVWSASRSGGCRITQQSVAKLLLEISPPAAGEYPGERQMSQWLRRAAGQDIAVEVKYSSDVLPGTTYVPLPS
jgi:phenylacetate-coenzyme A ligase PaaK-like adenylate-forming protein